MTHVAFGGVTVDHLYRDCPGLVRALQSQIRGWDLVLGAELAVGVDPLGTDVCGWCVRKWKGTL